MWRGLVSEQIASGQSVRCSAVSGVFAIGSFMSGRSGFAKRKQQSLFRWKWQLRGNRCLWRLARRLSAMLGSVYAVIPAGEEPDDEHPGHQ